MSRLVKASVVNLLPMSSESLLDDPQTWQQYSLPVKASMPGVWASQIVIEGMHCAACAFSLEAALSAVPGVQDVTVNAATHRAKVVWSSSQVQPSAWFSAVERAGYRALPAHDNAQRTARQAESRKALWRLLVACFCMMQVMMYALPAYVAGEGEISPDMTQLLRWASWVLTLPVVLFSCTPFWANAWRDLRLRRISMDLPVALGMAITFVVSSSATFDPQGLFGGEVYFDSLTMFVFFLLSGRWLEWRLRDRTAGALEALMNRLPDSVDRRLPDGQFERVALHRLRAGDVVRVLPGESFPADGEILEGETLAEEALLTGESKPCRRGVGDAVLAGSHNLSSAVTVHISAVGEDTRFSQIVGLMEHAALGKPRLALLADRIAKPFLMLVLLTSGAAVLWWWPVNPAHAMMVAVAVLIVTCPCALSLATPAAMLATAGRLAREGVLVRELQALEALAQIDTVVFDKTGTLTRDAQRLNVLHTPQGTQWPSAFDNSLLALAAALASHSWHPLSRALVAATQDRAAARQVQEFTGLGLEGEVQVSPGGAWSRFRLGSLAFCSPWMGTFELPADAQLCQVHLCDVHGWVASFGLSEDLREGAAEVVAALRQQGLSVWVLSGDRPQAVADIASRLGIAPSQALGGCTPQDKLQRLHQAQAQGRRVLMVGDGLNDGPVLAAAEVSLAFGAAVPLAQSRSDLVMMGGDLNAIPWVLTRARQTLRVVRHNLWWAALYNLIFVPLAWVGWLPAWLAGLGMAASSLWVVLYSLQLARSDAPSSALLKTTPRREAWVVQNN
ncbi:MAG: cation-translocating P-type ATPase [Limnohabitans sp.]|nr:cation-translocating P-type ATPase [Limnohabitans sp.]